MGIRNLNTTAPKDWLTPEQEAELRRMGFIVGYNGAYIELEMTKQKIYNIWSPHYFSDVWMQDRGYARGYLADAALTSAELNGGQAVVFDDPISAAVYLKVQASTSP